MKCKWCERPVEDTWVRCPVCGEVVPEKKELCPHNSVQAGMFIDRCRDCGESV